MRLSAPPAEDPAAILMRTERAVLGSAGCGINWKTTESRSVSDGDPGRVETVYRGDVCNCQAWVRKDTGGRVVSLGLRSAC